MKIDQLPPPFDAASGVRPTDAPHAASMPSPIAAAGAGSARAPLTPLIELAAITRSFVTGEVETRVLHGIDLAAAREHGVCVTHTPGLSTEDIADFALALLLAAAREVVNADRFVRRGEWASGRYPMTRRVSGARLGIVGLGRIGRAVATRALAFGMDIAYTGRTPKADVPYRWCSDARSLAAEVDFLVVCASGGEATRALIDAPVLDALGPTGVLVNIARGAIIDEDTLVQALRERRILAAGLDVFCHEPQVAQSLLALDNVVLTPHMASTTDATVHAMLDLTFANLAAHFDGLSVPTPVS